MLFLPGGGEGGRSDSEGATHGPPWPYQDRLGAVCSESVLGGQIRDPETHLGTLTVLSVFRLENSLLFVFSAVALIYMCVFFIIYTL